MTADADRTPTPTEARNLAAVELLFAAFAAGTGGYDEFIADHCVYETAGFPVLRGRKSIVDFLFRGGMHHVAERYANPDLLLIRRLVAEIVHLAAVGNVVFSERIDHHYTRDGREVLTPRLVGVMEFDYQAKCTGWRDYHDPAYFTGAPTPRWPDGSPTALAPE